jgi:hypothetical protein
LAGGLRDLVEQAGRLGRGDLGCRLRQKRGVHGFLLSSGSNVELARMYLSTDSRQFPVKEKMTGVTIFSGGDGGD